MEKILLSSKKDNIFLKTIITTILKIVGKFEKKIKFVYKQLLQQFLK